MHKNLFWIRPNNQTGRNRVKYFEQACPACRVPIRCWHDSRQGGLDGLITVEGFGKKAFRTAVVGSWVGSRETPAESYCLDRSTLVSGGLLAYLLANDVKGLLIPERGVLSTREEPPIETERRLSELLPDKAYQSLVRKLAKKSRSRVI